MWVDDSIDIVRHCGGARVVDLGHGCFVGCRARVVDLGHDSYVGCRARQLGREGTNLNDCYTILIDAHQDWR